MSVLGVIPARLASTRFPNKPMARIMGMPMVEHVYRRCKMCDLLDDVWVATCDQAIYEHIESIGGKAVMTVDSHERASDRCAEAMLKIEAHTGRKASILTMIQGDEPLVYPEMIAQAVRPMLDDASIRVVNLAGVLASEDFEDPNQVKVVMDKFDNALYFSREPIPSRKKFRGQVPMFKQVCIIPFRRDFLLEYSRMEQTPLEIVESVDMLRILENGIHVRMIKTQRATAAVDTPEDLRRVERMMAQDALFKTYAGA